MSNIVIANTLNVDYKVATVVSSDVNTSISCAWPSNRPEGAYALALLVCYRSAVTVITPHEGFSLVAERASGSSYPYVYIFAKKITGEEEEGYFDDPVTFGIADGNNGDDVLLIRTIEGMDPDDGFGVVGSFGTGQSVSPAAVEITTEAANSTVLYIAAANNGNYLAEANTGYPEGTTGLQASATRAFSAGLVYASAYAAVEESGTGVGSEPWTDLLSNASAAWAAIAIELKQAETGPAIDPDGTDTSAKRNDTGVAAVLTNLDGAVPESVSLYHAGTGNEDEQEDFNWDEGTSTVTFTATQLTVPYAENLTLRVYLDDESVLSMSGFTLSEPTGSIVVTASGELVEGEMSIAYGYTGDDPAEGYQFEIPETVDDWALTLNADLSFAGTYEGEGEPPESVEIPVRGWDTNTWQSYTRTVSFTEEETPEPGIVSINGGAGVRAGSTNNVLITSGGFMPTVGVIGGILVKNFETAGDDTYTFSMPAATELSKRPFYGPATATFSGNGLSFSANTQYLPKTGYSYVTLTGTLDETEDGVLYEFDPEAEVGDQIAFPAAVTVTQTGSATATAQGTYQLEHIDAEGIVRFFGLKV